jgi:Ring finger domain
MELPIDEINNLDCIICSSPIGIADSGQELEYPFELPCGHTFGNRCLEIWRDRNNTCPICRAPCPEQAGTRIRRNRQSFQMARDEWIEIDELMDAALNDYRVGRDELLGTIMEYSEDELEVAMRREFGRLQLQQLLSDEEVDPITPAIEHAIIQLLDRYTAATRAGVARGDPGHRRSTAEDSTHSAVPAGSSSITPAMGFELTQNFHTAATSAGVHVVDVSTNNVVHAVNDSLPRARNRAEPRLDGHTSATTRAAISAGPWLSQSISEDSTRSATPDRGNSEWPEMGLVEALGVLDPAIVARYIHSQNLRELHELRATSRRSFRQDTIHHYNWMREDFKNFISAENVNYEELVIPMLRRLEEIDSDEMAELRRLRGEA